MSGCGPQAICGNGIGGPILLILVMLAGYGLLSLFKRRP